MPHDKNGNEIQAGDLVNVPCVIKSVCVGEFCTTDLETVEVMPGNGQKTTISAINAKQVVKFVPNPVGFALVDVTALAQHVVHLLQTQGDLAIGVVTGILKLIKAATAKDMLSVFAQLNQSVVDIQALIAAVKEEFGI